MAKSPNFRKAAPPPAPPAARPNFQFGGENQLPIQSGVSRAPVRAEHLPPGTRQQLEHLGWQDGEPVPPELKGAIAAATKRFDEERATAKHDIPAGWEPAKPKTTVNIQDLPASEQEELRGIITNYRQQAAGAPVATSRPAAPISMPTVEFDTGPPRTPSPVPIEPGRELGGKLGQPLIADQLAQLEQYQKQQAATAPPVASAPAPEDPPDTAGGDLSPQVCPRCYLDLRIPYDIVPTDDDKMSFIATFRGGQRFRKKYPLLDGSVAVVFRGLLSRESAAVMEQMRIDVAEGKLLGEAGFLMRMTDYQLAMSVECIEVDGRPSVTIPGLFELPYEETATHRPTRLEQLNEWFMLEAVPHDSLRHAVFAQFRVFRRLLESLEANSGTPGFWPGIESPH